MSVMMQRFERIAQMVPPCQTAADIGCDHGKLSALLLQRKRCEKVIAADVSAFSVEKTKKLAEKLHLSQVIEVRQGSGFSVLGEWEAQAAVLAGLALAWSWPGTDGSLYELSCLLHGHAEDRFGSSRIGIWRRCLRCIAQRPWLGGGPGTAALQLDMTFSRRIAETGVLRTVHVDNAHNVYLGCALDLGLPALGVLLAYLAAAFARWLRGRNQTLRPAFGLGVCACAVQACFGLGLCLTAPVFLILLALTAVPSDRSTEVDPWTTN